MVLLSIVDAFNDVPRRNWDTLYFYFDIHKTILEPDYEDKKTAVFYPGAKEVLQLLSNYTPKGAPRIVLGLYTCSHAHEIERYQTFFKENDINFQYVNVNPEVCAGLGCYEHKPYFNVLFEDKAGFRTTEWFDIMEWFVDEWNLTKYADDLYIGKDIPAEDRLVGHTEFYNKILTNLFAEINAK